MAVERDQLFRNGSAPPADFEFNIAVANVFDDMVTRSVPFYAEQQAMVREIARKFWIPGRAVYDLGCATGTTLVNLAADLPDAAPIVGLDNSPAMLDRAAARVAEAGLADRVELKAADLSGAPAALPLRNVGLVTLLWTLQFVPPLRRDAVISWIYGGMAADGVLVVTEKTLTGNSDTDRFFIDFHYDFKRANGYSEEELLRKREALENTLIPYRIEENLELFARNGFEIVETFFQWFNFAGFLCVKNPALRGRGRPRAIGAAM
jgi:tRNA (cmo5U34)-methyltransferase